MRGWGQGVTSAAGTTSHRIGRRTSLIPSARGRSSTLTDLLGTAADDKKCSAVAESASFAVALLEPGRSRPVASIVGASEMRALDPDQLHMVRRPPSYQGMRNYIGRLSFPGADGGRAVWFESLNELSHWRDLLVNHRVTQMSTQPLRVDWSLTTGRRSHVPDALLRLRDGTTMLVDITTMETVQKPRALAAFILTAATATALGWAYQLRSELPAQRVLNTSSVWACRHADPAVHQSLLARAVTVGLPARLDQVAQQLTDLAPGLWAVQHLVAHGALGLDLNSALQLSSTVHEQMPTLGRPAWLIDV